MLKNLFLLFALVFGQIPVYAASITGKVLDEEEAIAMAEVMLINTANNVIVKSVNTDKSGLYRISVKSGNYKIGAFAENYATVWIEGIVVGDADLVLDIQMTPSAFVEGEQVPASDDCD